MPKLRTESRSPKSKGKSPTLRTEPIKRKNNFKVTKPKFLG